MRLAKHTLLAWFWVRCANHPERDGVAVPRRVAASLDASLEVDKPASVKAPGVLPI